jgi:hypothetical protein
MRLSIQTARDQHRDLKPTARRTVMTRPQSILRYQGLAVVFILALATVPAHANPPLATDYFPSLCELLPSSKEGYQSEVTQSGVVLTPPSTLTGKAAVFVCPVLLTTSISNFNLTNLSYTMDVFPMSNPPVQPDCSLILDTINGARNVLPVKSILNAPSAPDTGAYGAVTHAYVNCSISSGAIRLNRYTAAMTYYQ